MSGGILRGGALATVCALVGCGHPGDPDPLIGTRPALERHVGGSCTARDASARHWRCRIAAFPDFASVDIDLDARGAWHGTASHPYAQTDAGSGNGPVIERSGTAVLEASGCCVPVG